jgi:hypothetical protein
LRDAKIKSPCDGCLVSFPNCWAGRSVSRYRDLRCSRNCGARSRHCDLSCKSRNRVPRDSRLCDDKIAAPASSELQLNQLRQLRVLRQSLGTPDKASSRLDSGSFDAFHAWARRARSRATSVSSSLRCCRRYRENHSTGPSHLRPDIETSIWLRAIKLERVVLAPEIVEGLNIHHVRIARPVFQKFACFVGVGFLLDE